VSDNLRDYQSIAVERTMVAVDAGRRRLYIELPTGTGKTRVLAEIARRVVSDGGRVLAVAHRKELVEQLADTMERVTGIVPGIVMGKRDESARPVAIASIQTLTGRYGIQRIDRICDAGLELLIFDEAHHVTTANGYGALALRVVDQCPSVTLLGATATPYRADRHRMQDVLTGCVFARSLGEMQADGWVASLQHRRIEIDELDLRLARVGRSSSGKDYLPTDLSLIVNSPTVVSRVVAATAPLIRSRRTVVVFAVDVKHAHALTRSYRLSGLSAETVWGDMQGDDRARVLEDFRSGRVQVVVNVAVLTEGFDLPEIDCVVMARPTMSSGLYVQGIGRGHRRAPGKTDCLVIDVAGNAQFADVRQVDLPAVTGELFVGDGTERGGKGAARWLLDPMGHAQWPWYLDRVSGRYVTSLWDDANAALLPDAAESGLHLPVIVRLGGVQPATDYPVPLRDAVGAIERAVMQSCGQLPSVARRDAPWLDTPPSDKQLAYLKRLNPVSAVEAIGATKGEVSGRITAEKVRRVLDGWEATLEVTR
jgi:superfamily II DNA or RNA helicase